MQNLDFYKKVVHNEGTFNLYYSTVSIDSSSDLHNLDILELCTSVNIYPIKIYSKYNAFYENKNCLWENGYTLYETLSKFD